MLATSLVRAKYRNRKFNADRPRKFRRAAKSAIDFVVAGPKLLEAELQRRVIQRPARRTVPADGRVLPDRFRDLAGLRHHGVVVRFPDIVHALEQLLESGPPIPRVRRKIRAAVKWLEVGREPHAHRPAARARRGLHRGHVDPVDIRALFAVDLDADEILVHHRRHVVVLERLAFHHVAPMAGRVADGQEDRLVLLARLGERLLAPRIPVHGIVRVLQQIRTRLVDETVRFAGLGGASHDPATYHSRDAADEPVPLEMSSHLVFSIHAHQEIALSENRRRRRAHLHW